MVQYFKDTVEYNEFRGYRDEACSLINIFSDLVTIFSMNRESMLINYRSICKTKVTLEFEKQYKSSIWRGFNHEQKLRSSEHRNLGYLKNHFINYIIRN